MKNIKYIDKIDNIAACIITGKIPTSSQDPYGIRRQVIAIINILMTTLDGLSIDLIIISALNNIKYSSNQHYKIKKCIKNKSILQENQ